MAYNSKNTTNRLIIIGTIAMLLYQQIQNLGMIIGLIPITGITLPLISYGGSSTLSYFILFGIILNLSPINTQGFRLHPRLLLQAIIDLFTPEEDVKPVAVLAFEKPKQALQNRLEQVKKEKEKRKVEKIGHKSQDKNNPQKPRDLFILSQKEKELFAALEDLKKSSSSKQDLKTQISSPSQAIDKESTQKAVGLKRTQKKVSQEIYQESPLDFFKEDSIDSLLPKNPYEIQSSSLSSSKEEFSLKSNEDNPKEEKINLLSKENNSKESSLRKEEPTPIQEISFDQLEKIIQLSFSSSESSLEKKKDSKES